MGQFNYIFTGQVHFCHVLVPKHSGESTAKNNNREIQNC